MKKIKLTQGKFTTVDDEDYEDLNKYKWFAHDEDGRWYALRQIRVGDKQKVIRMHRLITLALKGSYVDHINGDSLDNSKSNLRICTNHQNTTNQKLRKDNTSGLKGATWDKNKKKWFAQIRTNRKRMHLGYFNNVLDAAIAYDRAAEKYHGEYAKTNKNLGLL